MIDKIEEKIIVLIRNVISGAKLPDGFSISEAEAIEIYKLAKKHDVANIVYKAIADTKLLDEDKNVTKLLSQEYLKSIRRYTRQQSVIEKIAGVYEQQAVDYILLKGSEIRRYYPEGWMRTSNDVDILVRPEDYERAYSCLTKELPYKKVDSCGYHTGLESDNKVEIEIHNKLNDEYIYDFSVEELTGKTWERAKLRSGDHCYALDDDYFYLYNIAHMMRHFADGGCGIRFFIDLWVLNSDRYFASVAAREGIDAKVQQERRRRILKEYGLDVFEENALKIARSWMEGKPHKELNAVEKFVFAAGTFGTLENRVKLGAGRESGKLRYLLSRIFVSRDYLKLAYPVVEKYRFLTPFYEVRRWIALIFGKKSRAFIETQMLTKSGGLTPKEIQSVKESMGL